MRDYEASDEAKAVLAALEEAAGNREVGGQTAWQPEGWDEDSDVDDGGAAIPA